MTDLIQERIKSLEQRLATEPQSPLFARLASYYLQAGRANDALRLCDDGLALYPFYSTAHLVKGKTLLKLGMMAEAKHEYVVVHELLPTNDTLAKLVSSIDMGSSVELSPAPTADVASKPEIAAVSPSVAESAIEEAPPAAIEEIPRPEPLSTKEPPVPTEPISAYEPFMEQAEIVTPVEPAPTEEDAFGFKTPPVIDTVQPPPSGYETPGFGIEEKMEPATADADFDVTPEAPTGTPSMTEEPQASPTDYGFEVSEETPPMKPLVEEVSPATEVVESLPSNATEDSFGTSIETPPVSPFYEPPPLAEATVISAPPVSEPTREETPPITQVQTPDWFEAFSQLEQPPAETAQAPPEAAAEEENPFAMFGTEQAPATAEGEPFEEFAARSRMEFFGTEDTVTLEQYFGPSSPAEPPAAPDQIGELAEKLKSSPRITPPVINYSEKAPQPATERESPAGSGFVTPTLAEIYVNQGWFDDAIKAYRALAVNKPAEKDKFEQRIAEIEELKKKQ